MEIDVGEIFLSILETVSNFITTLLGCLPNPDPFPDIIEQTIDTGAYDATLEAVAVGYYWLDSFFVADAVITCLSLWFLMFPIAWIIMMLWKWINAR